MSQAQDRGNPLLLIARAIVEADGKPITSSQLGQMLRLDEDQTGNPTVRHLVLEAMEEYQVPIGASSKGYFLIKSESELFNYQGNLDRRISGIYRRRSSVGVAFMAYQEKEWNRVHQKTL